MSIRCVGVYCGLADVTVLTIAFILSLHVVYGMHWGVCLVCLEVISAVSSIYQDGVWS